MSHHRQQPYLADELFSGSIITYFSRKIKRSFYIYKNSTVVSDGSRFLMRSEELFTVPGPWEMWGNSLLDGNKVDVAVEA